MQDRIPERAISVFLAAVVAAVSILVSASWCVVVHAAEWEPDPELVAKAQAEGRVVLYTATPEHLALATGERFTERFGIPVEVNRATSGRIFSRLLLEAQAGVHQADVTLIGNPLMMDDLARQGLLAPFKPSSIDYLDAIELHEPGNHPEGYYYAPALNLHPNTYNTEVLAGRELPRTWKGLLDPQWHGEMVAPHPRTSGPAAFAWWSLKELYGWEYLEALADLDLLVVASLQDLPTIVASGERTIGLQTPQDTMLVMRGRGHAISWMPWDDPMAYAVAPQAVLANAPNPNAARLFQEFNFSRAAAEVLAGAGRLVGMNGLPTPPESMQAHVPLNQIRLLPVDFKKFEEEFEEFIARFIDIFGDA